MAMKLPTEWKELYLHSLEVPVLGRPIFGPLLRGLWKAIQFFHRETKVEVRVPDGLLSTYASTIDGLRRQVENIERRTAALEADLAQVRESARVQQQLAAAALEGLQRRLKQQEQHVGFQRDALTAAVSGLRRRASPANEVAANEAPAPLSLGSTRC
jgi:hypothetical protein